MMDETSSGERCKRHLETLIGNLADRNLVFWPHKNKLVIEDADLFHQIAQATKKTTLTDLGGFYYTMDVLREDRITDHWIVVLDADQTETFLNKYGGQYKIVNE